MIVRCPNCGQQNAGPGEQRRTPEAADEQSQDEEADHRHHYRGHHVRLSGSIQRL